ncbi:MAG: APC family permease [Planctomycetota bacterium]
MHRLNRQLGVTQAVSLGLGSILGTGVFISIALGADAAGGWVVLATVIAALLATSNALSSAQLAAAMPISGGTYEYGTRLLHPFVGFAAGWLFLCAKSASAATAALGCATYTLRLLDIDSAPWTITIAITSTAGLTLLVLTGIRRSSTINAIIVTITVLALLALVISITTVTDQPLNRGRLGLDQSPDVGLLTASALMFVAFTGYGRIATLGEEVRDPQRTIPRAIIVTMIIATALYITVAAAAVVALGADGLAASIGGKSAPLEAAAQTTELPWLPRLVALGAVTAMLGVLLNLILGTSRVLLAMGRRGDMPALFGRVDAKGRAPAPATIAVGFAIIAIVSVGSITLAWSFSAFTVLLYYAITNLAALRLPVAQRLFPRWIAATGLVVCFGLAWWVELRVWLTGLGVLAVGYVVRWVCHRLRASSTPTKDSTEHRSR